MSEQKPQVPNLVISYAKTHLDSAPDYRRDNEGELNYLRNQALDAIKKYKRLRNSITGREAEKEELTAWLKSITPND